LAKQAQLLSERARRDAVKLERAAAHAQKLAARAHVRRLYEIRRAHEASARGHPLVRRPRSASPEKRLALLRDRRAALQNDLRTLPTRYDDEIIANDAEREKVAARLREVRAANNAAAGGDAADDAPLFCDEWALHRLRQAEVALEAHREAVSLAEVFEGWMRGALAPWSEWLPASAAAAAQPPSPEGGLFVRGGSGGRRARASGGARSAGGGGGEIGSDERPRGGETISPWTASNLLFDALGHEVDAITHVSKELAPLIKRAIQLDGDMQAELCCEQCGALLREPVLVGATGATVCAGCAPPGEECAPNALVATIVGRFDLKSATR
jgi:hypothetical protein